VRAASSVMVQLLVQAIRPNIAATNAVAMSMVRREKRVAYGNPQATEIIKLGIVRNQYGTLATVFSGILSHANPAGNGDTSVLLYTQRLNGVAMLEK
jgi:hypothetical protein